MARVACMVCRMAQGAVWRIRVNPSRARSEIRLTGQTCLALAISLSPKVFSPFDCFELAPVLEGAHVYAGNPTCGSTARNLLPRPLAWAASESSAGPDEKEPGSGDGSFRLAGDREFTSTVLILIRSDMTQPPRATRRTPHREAGGGPRDTRH